MGRCSPHSLADDADALPGGKRALLPPLEDNEDSVEGVGPFEAAGGLDGEVVDEVDGAADGAIDGPVQGTGKLAG